ncbi:MAG: hypothetical protein K6T66_10280 [Peptococcaceae bacterium]|nr:hypothetical protein [Peptococcaceae bacterium]
MLPKTLTADLHTHPLGDRYCRRPVKMISREDRKDIRAYIHHLISRGVQVAACTDHDMVAGGLFARDLAAGEGLPIIIVPGTEVSVLGRTQRLHLIALNIQRDLPASRLTLREAAREIHAQGGAAVLAHPVRYPHEIKMDPGMLECLDGLETCNGSEGVFDAGHLLDAESRYGRRFILQTAGSDEHWERDRAARSRNCHACSFEIPVSWLVEKKIISRESAEAILKAVRNPDLRD